MQSLMREILTFGAVGLVVLIAFFVLIARLTVNSVVRNSKAAELFEKLGVAGARECVEQLFIEGPTWEANILNKAARNALRALGYVGFINGYSYLTPIGMRLAVDAEVDRKKDLREALIREASRGEA